MTPRWVAGTQVMARNIWHGRVFSAFPFLVVEDRDDLVTLFLPPGAVWKRPIQRDGSHARIPYGTWTHTDEAWYGQGALRFFPTGESHSVLAWRGRDRIARWYINLELPYRRTSRGLDTRDNLVDIDYREGFAAPRLKDEDELCEAQSLGVLTPSEVARIRRDAERALALVQQGHPAITTRWESWRPPAHWTIPTLPSDWDQVHEVGS